MEPTRNHGPEKQFLQAPKIKSDWHPKCANLPKSVIDFTDELEENLRAAPKTQTNQGKNFCIEKNSS